MVARVPVVGARARLPATGAVFTVNVMEEVPRPAVRVNEYVSPAVSLPAFSTSCGVLVSGCTNRRRSLMSTSLLDHCMVTVSSSATTLPLSTTC